MASAPDTAADAHWERLQDLFTRALEVPPEQQESFVRQQCPDDPALVDEVLSLIACDLGTGTGPLTNAMGSAIDATSRERRGAMVGKMIGAYRVTSVLGHGGTGTVYLGERADDQYSAKVAIKIVDSAAVHPELGMRFRAERQILANLNHPNIARLIDAGETEDERPYLVMEYVEGKTADVYCDEQRLSINERLELFLQVCSAVQYAHQNLIVHRDLKPANILVTPDGVPKLLDFGIAKLLDSGNAGAALALTRMNDRLLTPEYAAPEQILGQQVTTSSDVYALGTVLYELLTGSRPFVVPSATTQLELERLICISDPPRPSSAITRAIASPTSKQSAASIASARDVGVDRLAKRLKGDLDAICMRALRKEPQHRYGSVEQLADDIRRYLANEPVLARQGNWFYYSQRFVRKYAIAVSGAVIFVVLIIAFGIAMSIQAQRIANERDRATKEQTRAERVSNFMLDVFGAADPFVTQGREVTARELLDQAAGRIDNQLQQEPEVRARLLRAIGQAYCRQGHCNRALPYLQQAATLYRQLDNTDSDAVATVVELAKAQRQAGQLSASDSSMRSALQLLARNTDSSGLNRARLSAAFGRLYLDRGDQREAEKYLTESISLMRKAKEAEPYEMVDTLRDLSSLQMWMGDAVAAERTAREAVQISRDRGLAARHPARITAEAVLAELLIAIGDHQDEAAGLLQEVLAARKVLYGEASSEVAETLDLLARVREGQGKRAEAERLLRQALIANERSLGPEHPLTGYQHTSLALMLLKHRNAIEAEQESRSALEIFAKSFTGDHPYIASAKQVLGEALIAQGRYVEAEDELKKARGIWQRTGAPAWRVGRADSALGEAIYHQGRLDEAEALLQGGYRAVFADGSAIPDARERAQSRLLNFYRETGRPQKIPQLTKPAS